MIQGPGGLTVLGSPVEMGHRAGGREGQEDKERRKRRGGEGGQQVPCPRGQAWPRMTVCLVMGQLAVPLFVAPAELRPLDL